MEEPEMNPRKKIRFTLGSIMKTRATLLVFVGLTMMVTLGRGDVSSASPVLAGKIAYVCGSHANICLFNLATGTNTQFAVSGVNPKLSPDGTRIAFQSSGGIYVMNADGTNPTLIQNFGAIPAWSQDGLKIAFHSNGIWVMHADGSGLQALTSHGSWPAFSPTGTQITFSSNLASPDYDLWLMNSDGSNPHLLLSRPGNEIDVVWLPSTQIHFGGFVDKRSGGDEIFGFDPATSSLTRLTFSAGADFEPASSPDGSMIAFASSRKPQGIYVMNADGSSPRLIIAGGRQPSWGP